LIFAKQTFNISYDFSIFLSWYQEVNSTNENEENMDFLLEADLVLDVQLSEEDVKKEEKN
jgi:hypothetical protein